MRRCHIGKIQLAFAAFLIKKYSDSPTASGSLDSFSDSASVSSYAVKAMQLTVSKCIMHGSNGKLNLKNNAARAEAVAILMRYCEMGK